MSAALCITAKLNSDGRDGRVEDGRGSLGAYGHSPVSHPRSSVGSRAGAPVWPGGPDPHHVSSPLHVARNVRISRIARPHLLHAKAYGTYPAGATFGPSRRTR